MCGICGCAVTTQTPSSLDVGASVSAPQSVTIAVLQDLLAANDTVAAHNRAHFDEHAVFVINLMSSPGSGKTALLEATIDALAGRYRLAVIEGDLETENDARRIRARGVHAVQITTGSACHLDAAMVHKALHALPLAGLDLLFIENVGNLVCPAAFDLGQHANVTVLSVTEGDDKPAKYPVIFRTADAIVLSKVDLLPVLDDFSAERAEQALRSLGSTAPMIPTAVRRPVDVGAWIAWLAQSVDAHHQTCGAARSPPSLPAQEQQNRAVAATAMPGNGATG